jgi:hypothetical protein
MFYRQYPPSVWHVCRPVKIVSVESDEFFNIVQGIFPWTDYVSRNEFEIRREITICLYLIYFLMLIKYYETSTIQTMNNIFYFLSRSMYEKVL